MYPKGYLTYTNFTAIVYPHPTCHIQAAGPIRRTSGRQSSEVGHREPQAGLLLLRGSGADNPLTEQSAPGCSCGGEKAAGRGQSPWSPREAGACTSSRCPCPPLALRGRLMKQHSVRRARQRLHPRRERSVRTTEHMTGTRSYIHHTERAAGAHCVHSAFLSFSHLDQRVKE